MRLRPFASVYETHPSRTIGRPIVSYRYFLDNRMAESPHNGFRLETDRDGPVIFTVHAVDESGLAGAAQVQLVVQEAA